MIIEQPARKSDTQDNCCTVFHPDFDVKLQKILHPQPMSGQGGYAVVSRQNQGIDDNIDLKLHLLGRYCQEYQRTHYF